jgi:hypothetical protein
MVSVAPVALAESAGSESLNDPTDPVLLVSSATASAVGSELVATERLPSPALEGLVSWLTTSVRPSFAAIVDGTVTLARSPLTLTSFAGTQLS